MIDFGGSSWNIKILFTSREAKEAEVMHLIFTANPTHDIYFPPAHFVYLLSITPSHISSPILSGNQRGKSMIFKA